LGAFRSFRLTRDESRVVPQAHTIVPIHSSMQDAWKQEVNCTSVFQEEDAPSRIPRLTSCTNSAENVRARYFRVRLTADVDCKWNIHEVYIGAT
jgi:hypothetical protein